MRKNWKKKNKPHPKVYCPKCNIMVGHVDLHVLGVGHKQRERLQALLKVPCMTFSEIGLRLGITRERVRQIALTMTEETGRERQHVCKIGEMLQREDSAIAASPLLMDLKELCKRFGFEFQLSPAGTSSWSTRRVFVNGHKCQIGTLPVAKRATKHYLLRKSKDTKLDFQIRKSARDGSWWVLPNNSLTSTATGFVEVPVYPQNGATSYRHDYSKYKEAWQLLERKVENELGA